MNQFLLRLLLGQAQVISATVAMYLLLTTGMSNKTLGALIVALTFLALSRLIFHGGKPRPPAPALAVSDFMDMKKLVAEFLGTFALVFAGTGAITINDVSGGSITHVGIALTFGLVVLAMIYTMGDVSGAHLNPAVTVAFWISGRFPGALVAAYAGVQIAGAVAASLVLHWLFPKHPTLGMTLPAGSEGQSFVLEFILTFILMLVILNVSTGAKEKGITAGIAVGAVIALEAMFAGPICGACMNPARSIAPALVSMNFAHLWLYLAAPVLGAVLAVFSCRCMNDKSCCPISQTKTS